MSWMLVLVYIISGQPYVKAIDKYKSMYDCFYAFEEWEDRVPETGTQLLCIKEEEV